MNPIKDLNKTFDSRIRLGIMSALMVNLEVSFIELKELLVLEESGTIKVQKGFIGRKTSTTYTITKAGDKAFKAHIAALEAMIKATK